MSKYTNFSLEGKIALVTGAVYGIGFAIAKAYAEAGATIVFNDRTQENMEKGLKSYEEAGINEANTMRKAYSANWLSSPSVISKAIVRAVRARHPRERYHAGFASHMTLFLHACLPTKWWDAMMRKGGKKIL